MQFLREQSYQGHLQTVNITRATLCELGMQILETSFRIHLCADSGTFSG